MEALKENQCIVDVEQLAEEMSLEMINKFQGEKAFNNIGDLREDLIPFHRKLKKQIWRLVYGSAIKTWND